MALRLKKDIKKSSYYVWFLGAQESRGLRGDEYALPAIDHLERRARDLEPFKVTLQVSHKGLKIIQNVAPKGKQQTIKHFIPHSSITSAVQQGDVVAVVLLLFNPVTSCPIHVHAYRCDSDRTAEILCAHLQALIDKPENQKKFADIERKLQSKGALPTPKKIPDSSLGSEVSTRESESGSSEERCVATLYDSLAAELKQKLSTGKSPILLPPRDYDTVHRQKGNLSGIDTRRCLNQNIVGVNARRKLESSGGSSGIGSDLAPSPDQNEYPRQHDNQSTSEEDWAESTAYMMHEGFDVTPPRRAMSPRRELPPSKYQEDRIYQHESLERPSKYSDEVFAYPRRYASRQQSPPVEPLKQINRNSISMERISNKDISKPEKIVKSSEQHRYNGYKITNNISKMHRGTSEGSLKLADGSISPKDRFNVAKEKFMNLERERFNQELEKHMQIRRNMLEKNNRNSSPDEVKTNRATRKWSQEDDEEDIGLERRAELPRVSQRQRENGYRDKTPNRVEPQRFYEYGSDEFYDKRFTNERRRGDIDELEEERFMPYPEPAKDYRSSKRYDASENRRSRLDLERRIDDDDVRDSRIEPVIDDRPKRNDPKRASRIDHDRYDPRMNADEVVARRVPVNEDDWSDHRRGISRTRMLKDHPASKRHSSYDTEERRNFEVRKSYAEVNNYPDNRYYEPRYRQDVPLRYRDAEERERYNGLDREPPKIRHSYAEPLARNRVGVAPVRPY